MSKKTRALGPRSALTSFLKEHGISNSMINSTMRRNRLLQQQTRNDQDQDQPETPSTEIDNNRNVFLNYLPESGSETETNPENIQDQTENTEIAQEQAESLENTNENQTAGVVTRSNKRSKATKKVLVTKKKKNYESDYESDDFVQEQNNSQENGLGSGSARKGGHIEFCEICMSRFIVRTTIKSKDRILCPKCTKSVDNAKNKSADSASKTNASKPKKQTTRTRRPTKRKITRTEDGLLETDTTVPSLQDLCIRAVGRNIDKVESFGEISLENSAFSGFFESLGNQIKSFKISVAHFGLEAVKSLTKNCHNLEELALDQCHSFDEDCLKVLAGIDPLSYSDTLFPYLENESLENIEQNGDTEDIMKKPVLRLRSVETTCHFKNLNSLSITEPQKKLECYSMILLLKSLGKNLVELKFSGCDTLDDDFLIEGIKRYCRFIEYLDLSETSITSKGLCHLFGFENQSNIDSGSELPTSSKNNLVSNLNDFEKNKKDSFSKGLVSLNIGKIGELDDLAMVYIIRHSSYTLKTLDIHSADTHLTEKGILSIAGIVPELDQQVLSNDIDKLYKIEEDTASDDISTESKDILELKGDSVDSSGDVEMKENPVVGKDERDQLLEKKSKEYVLSVDSKIRESKRQKIIDNVINIHPCKVLETLIMSFVRVVDDDILDTIVKACPSLSTIYVNGNSKVTPFAPEKPGLKIIGRESDSL
ncbi:hypothetical protein BB558_004223 [Smittium angustum]|uniref:DNA repair protein RAD7 n=1 Tax=Smittium angustum TaxID=133377 RepID=A0A2U1J3U8_SMIAN|nr:hypothetical protein BB558_004223 [Smittium angustum]